MRLKSLELVGFKSFLDATVISFSPGATAVVGPNGCGKSNVVDAIRWVLGEQAPTRLRGKSADDLIYAGNDSNAAAGMAEVTLMLEAEDGSSLPDPYDTLSEVAVTRRVYRSGDSEYLLNRIPCRLKDITEFFMAAQIHSRGYALIEQGRIEEIIQAKPHELRTMVEEAAGLSLFKGRREMSERKLERVKENLARVDDVLREIERQLNFARRQAKKAEAYKVIRAELSELERLAAGRRLIELHAELAAQSSRELELRESSETARRAIDTAQGSSDDAGAALASARDELAAAGRELDNLRAAFEERARTRGFLERRLDAISELEPDLVRRLADLDVRAIAGRAARAESAARLARETSADDGVSEAALAALRAEHQAAERALRDDERHTEDFKDELAELVREAAVIRGRLADLSGERSDLEAKLAAAAAEMPEVSAALNRAQLDLGAAESALSGAREEAARLEAIRRDAADREIETRSALEHQASRLSGARTELDTAMTRAQRIVSNGAGDKLRSVLESLNGDRPLSDPALLLDVVKAPPALEPALRAVLGEQLDAVIVESPLFALRAIEILKQNNGGRLSFIPEAIGPGVTHAPIEAPGISGRLLDLVEVEPRFVPMAEAVMGHVMVADDLNCALAASNLNGIGTVFVTRDGDLLAPERMISGGSGARTEDGALLDWHSGARSVEAAQRTVAEAETAHQALGLQLEADRAASRAARESFDAARNRIAEAERRAAEARAAIAKAEQRLALAEAGSANTARRMAELATAGTGANARLEDLAILEQQARARLADASGGLADRRAEARRLGDAMLTAGARVEARKRELAALAQELGHLQRITAEVETQLEQTRAQLLRSRAERVEFQGEIANLDAQDQAGAARRGELEELVGTLGRHCAEREAELADARAALKAARERLATLESEAVDCSRKSERARTLIEELERSFAEKFLAAFASVLDDLETALSGRDPVADDARLHELRARAEKIGEVNLAAESEVKELEERAGLLTTERADLQAAVNDLTHTIQKLNREARKRFAETFEGAAKNFELLFPKLLRGGKGRMELTAADDVLDAGVNILVQPAGKRVKEIGLLSGGEKALSAMALIFSLFLLNPSPFCIMDEVDAPLDEFSLAAFTGLVSELKQNSQFIIITHNQRTMQSADHIHGVTMDRPGISRIISLKIPQAA
jgi:chromosome segregation protein